MLEKPKKLVRRTETCQGHRPNGAFLPPTIRVSGRVCTVGIPHSADRAAETVYAPGSGEIGSRGGGSGVGKEGLKGGRKVDEYVDEIAVVVVNVVVGVAIVECLVGLD